MNKTSKALRYDPRTKIIISFCLSTLGVFMTNTLILAAVFAAALMISLYFKVDLLGALKKIKHLLYMFLIIIILQSLFIKEGDVLVGIGEIKLLTDVGIRRGINYLLRVCIIILSGVIVLTTDAQTMMAGLNKWKLPYEIGFMTMMGIRFVPIFVEEFKDTLTAIQLRGIRIKSLKLKEKIDLYTYILAPVTVGAITKAQSLSLSAETRGFGIYNKRTSLIELHLQVKDYILSALFILATVAIFVFSK